TPSLPESHTLSLHDALPIWMMTASPRSNTPSTATTPAGNRLLPRRSAPAAPSSTVSVPAGLTAPAIHPLRAERGSPRGRNNVPRSEEHTSELQSRVDLVCRL